LAKFPRLPFCGLIYAQLLHLWFTIPRKVILEEEEDAEFGSLYREYQETGGRRIALDRHFYFFPWTSRYICWTDTSTSSIPKRGNDTVEPSLSPGVGGIHCLLSGG